MSSVYETSKKTNPRVKVLTYNIASGIDVSGNLNINRIANVIKETGADIIGLQEVDINWGDRSDYMNQAELLAQALDMYAFFAPIYEEAPIKKDEVRRQFGLLVLSKYPIIRAINHEMTRLSTQESEAKPKLQPGFLEALIDVEGNEVSFYVTHLDYRVDPIVRETQVAEMLETIPHHSNVILMGDFNAEPSAAELQSLFVRFRDSWNGLDGKNQVSSNTFPVPEATKRIDYILSSHNLNVSNVHVIKSDASDHFPVVADFEIK